MSIADEIQKLQALQQSGALSMEEFNQAKGRLLNHQHPAADMSSNPAVRFIHKMGRSRQDAMLGGVCGGLALQTQMPSWVWRLIFASSIFLFGTGALIYILLWLLMPYSDATTLPVDNKTINQP